MVKVDDSGCTTTWTTHAAITLTVTAVAIAVIIVEIGFEDNVSRLNITVHHAMLMYCCIRVSHLSASKRRVSSVPWPDRSGSDRIG